MHGVDWEFVQHDLTISLPYLDESFDFVMVKDMSCIAQPEPGETSLIDECFRVLRKGGSLEIWESDLPIRVIHPSALQSRISGSRAGEQAERTGTYLVGPQTVFSESRNHHVRDYNEWVREALSDRGLNPSPSTEMGALLVGEKRFAKGSTSARRIAIPLGDISWERDPAAGRRPSDQLTRLTAQQASYRSTALSVVAQTINSLEPLLKEIADLGTDGWDKWWNGLMSTLLSEDRLSYGECLEFGVWWGTKA